MAIRFAQNSTVLAETSAEDERRLVERAIAGEGRAFADLVKPHLAMLHRLAWRHTSDSALAEDAVQEALVVAYGQLGKYTPGTSMRAWLASIAVRRAFTLRRGESRRRAREQVHRPESLGPSAELIVEAAQNENRLRALLDRMPTMRREAVLLRMDVGLSHGEIALALGTSEESVRVLVHLGLKELRGHCREVSHA